MKVLRPILILLAVTIPTVFGFLRMPTEMTASIGGMTVVLFFAYVDRFKKFKGGGIEAELRDAVDRAYAAVEQLKDLGLSLAAPIVDELAVSGRMLQFLTLRSKLSNVEKIEGTLRVLGASDSEISAACSTLYDRVKADHVRSIFRNLAELNSDKREHLDGIDAGEVDGYGEAQIRELIASHDLSTNEETDERFLDLRHFIESHKLRRDEIWQS